MSCSWNWNCSFCYINKSYFIFILFYDLILSMFYFLYNKHMYQHLLNNDYLNQLLLQIKLLFLFLFLCILKLMYVQILVSYHYLLFL